MSTVRLTMAQALVRYLISQSIEIDGHEVPLFAGIFAIFGHGNVAGLGETLAQVKARLPTYRAHNEQAMAHAAIGYAKAMNRRRMLACTTSIGPGATNLVTAAAVAHVNRLPVLLLPGDTFATRLPDPVLQQLEQFDDPTVTVNDCFKPVSKYWDRITRPEQILVALPHAMRVLTDPAQCGPVTLALPQDVQAEAYAYPQDFFTPQVHHIRRPAPDQLDLERASDLIRGAASPLIIAGGGVHYSGACQRLSQFATARRIPVAETQAGKGALPWDHPLLMGAIGVTGSQAANTLAREADLIIAIGTRLSDFTTASRSLFAGMDTRLLSINVAAFDAIKHGAVAVVGDALVVLDALDARLSAWRVPADSVSTAQALGRAWRTTVSQATAASEPGSERPPSDAQVLGVANRCASEDDVVVCAAGGLPGELHKLWRATGPGSYHVEYGYSCMGYEIAGALGVRMARKHGEVWVLVGDGSYLMLNSEIATSVMLQLKLIIVVLDNGGFGCINRLQASVGGASFNNLFEDGVLHSGHAAVIDFAAHAAALGAKSETAGNLAELEAALHRARASQITYVVVIRTDPAAATQAGGAWWDVPVAQVSNSADVNVAHAKYLDDKRTQRS